ncbi:MAG TPA: AAA family ATPase [Solirubrobacterales bacterium]|nr:AAA family ATPase [Solirubrobacterales bacterium]
MIIESLKINGFRSLYETVVEPGSFTVLAGANNAGKTTLADALDFLAEVHRFRLEVALSRKGGFENVAFRRMRRTRRPISLEITAAINLKHHPRVRRRLATEYPESLSGPIGEAVITHRFSFKAASSAIAADFSIVEECITIGYREDPETAVEEVASLHRKGAKLSTHAAPEENIPPPLAVMRNFRDEFFPAPAEREIQIEDTVLLTEAFPLSPITREFVSGMSGIRIYQISPLESRRAGVPTPNPPLERYGENLPALVDYFRKRAKKSWRSVFTAMQLIVPHLVDISTDFSIDRRLVLQFKEQGVGRAWNASEVSDGTIQSLALFCALFDPRTTLAFIEEPENSVHPWIVRVFAEACRTASEQDKQIFVTTHSPALLQQAKPSEVKLMWRSEGRSSIASLLELDPEAGGLWESGDIDVFELLDSGALRQAVPEGSA